MRIKPKIIIKCLKNNNGLIRKTARDLGISPGTVINWKIKATSIFNKFKLKTKELKRKSTKPKKARETIINADSRIKIINIRKETRFCAVKIKGMLNLPHHHLTIHRYLKKKGLVSDQKAYKRPLFQNTIHMHAKNVKTLGKLQMDVKYVTPELSGLEHTCYLYAIIDIFSRFKQGIILPLLDQSFAIEAIELLSPLLPFKPDFIQTDNGLEFQKRFQEFITLKLHWQHHYIHKSNPNENAIIERSFRTDQEEFFFFRLKKPKNIIELNDQYQKFMHWYNHERPHLSLDLMTPIEKMKSVQ